MATLTSEPKEIRLSQILLVLQDDEKISSANNQLQELIQIQKVVNFAELQNLVSHEYIKANEMPAMLQSRGRGFRAVQIEKIKKQMGISLFYVFDDGVLIEYDQIMFHPYCKFVHPDILPLLRGIYGTPIDLNLYRWIPGTEKFKLLNGDVEYVILRILKNIQKMLSNQRLELIISWGSLNQNPGLEWKAEKVQFVEFLDAANTEKNLALKYAWKNSSSVSGGEGALELKIESTAPALYKNFFYDTTSSRLKLHTLGQFINDYAKFCGIVFSEDAEFNFMEIPKEIYNLSVLSHETVQDVLAFLQSKKAELKNLNLEFEHKSFEIPETDYKAAIYASGLSHFRFSLKYENKENFIEAFNFGQGFKNVCLSLADGFKLLLGPAYEALERNPQRKQRDGKLLKHTGMLNFYLYEVSIYLLSGKNSQNKKFDTDEEFLEYIYFHLGKIYSNIDLIPISEHLSNLCSKKVLDELANLLRSLRQDFVESNLSVFCDSVEYKFIGAKKRWLEIIHCMLHESVQKSEGEVFYRAKAQYCPLSVFAETPTSSWNIISSTDKNMLQNLEHISVYPCYIPALKQNLSFDFYIQMQDRGWQVSLDGKELRTLSEKDIRWLFSVREQLNSAQGIDNQKLDWFELHPQFFIEGQEIDIAKAIELVRGGRLERDNEILVLQKQNIPMLDMLNKFWDRLQQSEQSTDGKNNYYKLGKSLSLEVLALRALGIAVQGGPEWQKVCAFYDSLSLPMREVEVSINTNAQLKSYQQKGLQWLQDLYQLRLGGILADDMGLGKTLQTLSFLDWLHFKNDLGRVLVLVPTTLVYTWASEAAKFTPKLPVLSYNSKEKTQAEEFLNQTSGGVLIVTYGLFSEHEEFFAKFDWQVHIYDEAQNLKNILTKRTSAVRKLPARYKLCLTGTPLENHLGEFYTLLDTVVPGSLGSIESFKKTYVNQNTISGSDMDLLKAKSRPLVLRRTKSEILKELPAKTISIVKIPFSDEQSKVYKEIASTWTNKVKQSIKDLGENKSQLMMLTALLRLRQVCSDPAAIPGIKFPEDPPKIDLLAETLCSIVESGESAIVFTQFIPTLQRMLKRLRGENLTCFSIDGSMTKANREHELESFAKCETGSVLCMTLKTGGVGLNLTKASYVFHLEPWWNPAVENQATDRVHRIGQEKPVQVYRYIMDGSIEEKIEILKDRKSAHFNALFTNLEREEDISQIQSHLSQTDFEFLLS